MKKRLRILSTVLTALLGIFVLLFISDYQQSLYDQSSSTEVEIIEEELENTIEFGIDKSQYEIIEGKIKPNEFLANLLLPHHINYTTIDALAKKSKEVFDVRKIVAGKKYKIFKSLDSLNKAQFFIYQPNAIDYVVYELGDSLKIYKGQKEVEIRERSISGIINSSLYECLQENNSSPALAVEMADIFAWTIDFYRIQKGDWFKAIYEVKYVDGEAIGIGNIKAVEFSHFKKSFYAFHFEQGDHKDDYFDENAESLRKAFLKSPLKFSRLSSRYTMRRFHPVQKRWKAHLGTDYAAPTGTPIMATGDGVVIQASYTKGNGKYVKIKHNSVYTTQYLHMSRRNVKNGQYVQQGDIIGYVGSTGLATGPHVCYRFWKNGKQVDHLREDFPSAEPVEEVYLADFKKLKTFYLESLEQIPPKRTTLLAAK